MAVERAALDAQAYRLMLDQSASHEVMRRKHRSRLPPVFEARDLFNTPGPRASNPLEGNQAEAPGTGALVQPRQMDPLVKTPLYLRLFQHLRVTTPTQWTISSPLLQGWRPFQLKVTRRRQ